MAWSDRRVRAGGRIAFALAAIGGVTAGYAALVRVNPTTIALSYVVVILVIASAWGIAESMVASLAAMLCFNFFFLPPVGTFNIADPQNWVALFAFLLTAIVVSQLSGRARARNLEAISRESDLQRLYSLSRALLTAEGGASLPAAIARHIADAFALESVGLHDQRTNAQAWVGESRAPDAPGLRVMPIQLGGQPIGSVAISDPDLSDTVLRSIANLAALGLERARGEEAAARAEAARHSSELRATILDALAHEFKTPLTSMKAAAGELVVSNQATARDRELAAIVDEELDRFQGLITDAVQMLRIDAGDFAVHRERHNLATIVEETLRQFARRLDGHELVCDVAPGLVIEADRNLLSLALRQLVDNALKYSPPSSRIEVRAADHGAIDLTVRNSGSTIPQSEQPRVVERFFRGAHARNIPGTGMGLAIVQQIAHAHGGTLAISSSRDAGTAVTLSLPGGDGEP